MPYIHALYIMYYIVYYSMYYIYYIIYYINKLAQVYSHYL